MQLEPEKTCFIRFGPKADELADKFRDPEDPSKSIPVSKHLKFLGFYIPDKIGIDITYHLQHRIANSNPYLEKM